MYRILWIALVLVILTSLLAACAAPATPAPTTAPAKPPAAAATAPPASASPAATAAAASTKPAAPAATAASTAPPAAKVKRGGTLVSARAWTYNDMDPHRSVATGPITLMIYDPLINYNIVDPKTGKHDLAPALAESWKVVDPTTIEMKMRQNVKFQDGSDWNADTAKWNIDRLREDKKSTGKHLVSEIESVTVVDPNTIRLKLKAPWATLFVNLTASTGGTGGMAALMVSKAAVDKGPDDILSTKPVGTGPMVMDQWLRDDRVVLKRWDGYWQMGADGKALPYLDGFVERFIQDASIQLVELKAGSVQLAENLEAKDIAGIKANPDLVYYELPWAPVAYFAFGFNQDKPPFKGNPKVAQAAQHALDREGMAKAMGFGLATPADYVMWTPALLGYNESIPKYKFDQAKAKQLLTEAGFPNGVDISLMTISRQPEQRIGEIAKQMWDQAGIRTTLDVMERLATIERSQQGNFISYFWRQSSSPDIDLQSRMILTGAPSNWSRYSNAKVDQCMKEGRSIYENKERQVVYERCLRTIMEDALIGAGYLLPNNKIFNKAVKGLTIHWAESDVREAWLDK